MEISQGGKFITHPEERTPIPLFAEVTLNSNLDDSTNYATLTHELGHLYCGHVGTPNEKWWPRRLELDRKTKEFEAESVSYLVCQRAGLDTPAAEYLSGYFKENEEVPNIGLDHLFKASMLIENMGRKKLPLRKTKQSDKGPSFI